MIEVAPWLWRESHATSGEIELHGELDQSWYQGRGVFGGITAAAILKSMLCLESDRSPRSLTVQCVAPAVAGPAKVMTRREHEGKRVSHLSSRLYCGHHDQEKLVALAYASFGSFRSAEHELEPQAPPSLPDPNKVPEAPFLPSMPAFCQHVSYRYCLGGFPYSGHAEPKLGGWCDLKDAGPVSLPYLAALLDAWAPALLPTLQQPMRAASIDFSYHFYVKPSEVEQLQRPFMYVGEVISIVDGYAEERDLLWDASGRPVASSRQLIALG